MKLAAVILASLLVPSLANAQVYASTETQDTADSGVGAFSLTVGAAEYMHGGLSLDLSKRLGQTPVYAHAQIDAGGTSEILGNERGHYFGAHAGLELRGCIGEPRLLCAYMGLDVGTLYERMGRRDDAMESVTSLTVGPRAGIEVGNQTRLRFGFDSAVAESDTGPLEMWALQLQLGLVTAF